MTRPPSSRPGSPRGNAQPAGFTLIEAIIAIVILGILAAGTSAFIVHGVEGYTDTARRDQLASMGRLAVERISRELRNALPNSVRVSGNCIEFMPLATGARYQANAGSYATGESMLPLPVSGFTAAASSFDAFDLSFTPGSGAYYVIVYPVGPGVAGVGNGDPYAGANPGARAALAGTTGAGRPANVTRVELSGTFQFARQSPAQRFFIAQDPVSFCVLGNGELRRYSGYGIQATQPSPPAGGDLLAESVQLSDGGNPVTPFRYTPGSLNRNGLAALDLRFMQGGEWIRLRHEVQIRNTP
ncbi:prepilin-type N-terminal cleavage/methylation domain-containing protein [Thermithiobacillus tepidarius DSM 3134]|uniref:PilW family protein n=1 Tax=Thermithiobacillus tepidarius TaxID=929 RepID=UPI0004044658|nr:prepilin-type N-terminal cleavage/methylation domain-containing protein [Thermithiobacillus tepidarius]